MRILVYPHSMEIGGSQLNAIELAAAVRERGHEVMVYAEEGPLLDRVHDLGLEHVPLRAGRFRPGAETALDLRRVARDRSIDVIHGYEWPPILEGCAAAWSLPGTACVGTVMSMAVAPFIPSSIRLAVGTSDIRDRVTVRRRGPVELVEPPVDVELNHPDRVPPAPPCFARVEGTARVVVVSRLVPELKLQGILTAVRAVGTLAATEDVELLVVGDGPARAAVAAEADAANARAGRDVVRLAGEWHDPRWAYGSADVCLGMGGSALRAMAFARPLVVQGEGGFFETLTPGTVDRFLRQGWFGVDDLGVAEAEARLVARLSALLRDPARCAELGRFARTLVETRFSLGLAARRQEDIYRRALAQRVARRLQVVDGAVSGVGLLRYKVRRRRERSRGVVVVDDFNAARAR